MLGSEYKPTILSAFSSWGPKMCNDTNWVEQEVVALNKLLSSTRWPVIVIAVQFTRSLRADADKLVSNLSASDRPTNQIYKIACPAIILWVAVMRTRPRDFSHSLSILLHAVSPCNMDTSAILAHLGSVSMSWT